MADQHTNSRNVGSGDGTNGESQKLDRNEENVEATQTKLITNIYYDCLDRIFEYLDIESLLHLADTCKRLQIAAAHYFGEKFSSIIISSHRNMAVSELVMRDGLIESTGLRFSLPLLRCFGNKISYLNVNSAFYNNYLKEYIVKYCGVTLRRIAFNNCQPVFPSEIYQQPFKSVETIYVYDVVLKEQLTNVAQWFPFLKNLFAVISFDTDFVGVCLSHLQILVIESANDVQADLTDKCLINLLQANRQLKFFSINIGRKVVLSTLLAMISGNTSILDLSVDTLPMDVYATIIESGTELMRFANEHPSIRFLSLVGYSFRADDAIAFIREHNSLQKFTFNVKGHSEYDRLQSQLDENWKINLNRVAVDLRIVELNRYRRLVLT